MIKDLLVSSAGYGIRRASIRGAEMAINLADFLANGPFAETWFLSDQKGAAVLIAAAGDGSRMRPLTDDKPKPMLSDTNSLLIDYALDLALESRKPEHVHVMIRDPRKDIRFRSLERHLQEREIPFFYQQGGPEDGYLKAVLNEAYSNPGFLKTFRDYHTLVVLPSDIIIERPSIKQWVHSHLGRDVTYVMAEAIDEKPGRVWIKPANGKLVNGSGDICEFMEHDRIKDAYTHPEACDLVKHTGAFLIRVSTLYNPLKMAAIAAAYSQNRGSVAASLMKMGVVMAEGFKEFNTPEDLSFL